MKQIVCKKTIDINLLTTPIMNTLPIPLCKNNFSNKLCPDDHVATIKYSGGIWMYTYNKIGQPINKNSVIDYSRAFLKSYIIIILESPHYWEYDKLTKNPLGPAQGKTGSNFDDYFIDYLNDTSCILRLDKRMKYEILFVNAVQYQASQGVSPLKPYKTTRNANFMNFWNAGFDSDLINRITKITSSSKDSILINAVTHDLKRFYVKNSRFLTITKLKSKLFSCHHPSSWKNIKINLK